MVNKFLDRVQEFYEKLNKMDKKREAVLVWALFAVLVFGLLIVTGTLTSGFHLVDDWEFAKYVDWMTLEGYSLWDCLREAVGFDLTLRFRPLYYINRVLTAYVFGINLTAMSVVKAFEIVAALAALYYCARQMKCNMVYAALFSLTVMVGYQSAVWWKLGPQESYDIMMFAAGFYFLLKWLSTEKRRYAVISVGAFFFMSIYKEPFILLLLFVGLYILYDGMRGKSVTIPNLWEAIRRRLLYLLAIGVMFAAEMFLLLFVIGTNNYSYVGLDESVPLDQYVQVWRSAAGNNLKWYVRFGVLMGLILLTYWEHLKKLGWEVLLAAAIIVPQCVTYSKTALEERYILPWVLGYAFFFVIVGCGFRPLSGKRRIAYMLCLFLMLAAHGRVTLREAQYFTYRGESIKTMMETTLELVQGTDKKVLSCFAPNSEGNKTMYYWFRLHGYDEVFYWEEDENKINRSYGPREDEQADFADIDVIVMYNEEDRHWCYEPSLDLSDFTEQKCGTITMYIRNEK
ncbi:MAG: hypothetical protein OSJ59_06020 [Lachnospiraceae bacterium]|nr:hypothetical protein [Lachnospiraceae bacterium]